MLYATLILKMYPCLHTKNRPFKIIRIVFVQVVFHFHIESNLTELKDAKNDDISIGISRKEFSVVWAADAFDTPVNFFIFPFFFCRSRIYHWKCLIAFNASSSLLKIPIICCGLKIIFAVVCVWKSIIPSKWIDRVRSANLQSQH